MIGSDDSRQYTECLYEVINGREIRVNACRSYGDTAVIPGEIGGLPVTELGAYTFSAGRRKAPAGVWSDGAEDGLGLEETVGAGASQEAPPLLEGERLRELILPESVKKVGAYGFYNCANLESLTCHSHFNDIGAGAFTGCKKLTRLDIFMDEGETRPGLKDILSELRQEVHVIYRTKEGETRLVFPEYYEDAVENTPARIVSVKVYGSGHFYRYCFDGRELQFKDYDAQFENLLIQDRAELAAEAAIGRLRWPLHLSAEAKERYETYIHGHRAEAARWLLRERDGAGLKWFLKFSDFDRDELAEVIQTANQMQAAEELSFLMDYQHEKFRPKRRKFEL